MADFISAFNYMMDDEDRGRTGKVTHDEGGITKYGISQNAYPHLDIANLTLDEAEVIYRRDYWAPIHGDEISSQLIANKLLDWAVNHGHVGATRTLQLALGMPAQDGLFGPATLAKLNAADPDKLILELRARIAVFYAQHSPANELLGQMRRAVR